jgi:hypothetical protein
MIHKERSRQTIRPLLLVLLILMFASSASAERKEKVLLRSRWIIAVG